MRDLLGYFWFFLCLAILYNEWSNRSARSKIQIVVIAVWIPIQFIIGGFAPYNQSMLNDVKEEASRVVSKELLGDPSHRESMAICWLIDNSPTLPESAYIMEWVKRHWSLTFDSCNREPVPEPVID